MDAPIYILRQGCGPADHVAPGHGARHEALDELDHIQSVPDKTLTKDARERHSRIRASNAPLLLYYTYNLYVMRRTSTSGMSSPGTGGHRLEAFRTGTEQKTTCELAPQRRYQYGATASPVTGRE
jgi:hypothetical protein